MLEHSRKSTGIKIHTDINVLCNEYAILSYQAMRAKDYKFICEIKESRGLFFGKFRKHSLQIHRSLSIPAGYQLPGKLPERSSPEPEMPLKSER